jgi:hypothetical protein
LAGLSGPEPGSAAGSTTIVVDTGRFLWVVFLACLIVEVSLVYLDLTVNWWRWSESGAIRRLFNTTREDGLASWFMVAQTLVAALVAWAVYTVLVHQAAPTGRRLGWLVVAVFFTYMCIDDGALVHERIGTAVKNSAGIGAYPSYAWQYVLLPFFAVMGAFTLFFLWREMPRRLDRLKLVAALACFVTAVGMDFVEGLDDGYRWLAESTGWQSDAIRHFSKSIEEFLEMLGMSIFLVIFIGRLAAAAPRLDIRFSNRCGA